MQRRPRRRVRSSRIAYYILFGTLALLMLAGVAAVDDGRWARSAAGALATPAQTATLAPIIALEVPSPTPTASPSAPPSATLPPTPSPTIFMAGEPQARPNCNRTVVQGTLHDGLRALNGLRVRVWWPDAPPDQWFSAPSGTLRDLGEGGYEVFLGDKPTAGWWLAAVVDDTGRLLSEAVVVETTERGCDDGTGRQQVRLDFWRREGSMGRPGATLTPMPPVVVATVTPPPVAEAPPPAAPPEPTPAPPQPGWDGTARTLKVPILMYHYISVPPPGSDAIRRDISVGPDVFRAQLITLREQGYTSITLRQLYFALAQGAPLPPKPVVLTFDDGYRDNYDNAFPIMQQEGFVGTFFLTTDAVDERNDAYMTWEQAVAMKEAGMEIASHTRRHTSLPGEPMERIWDELASSRALLQERLGEEVISFAYPYGHFDDGVAHLTQLAGYGAAVVTKQGVTHTTGNLMSLRRVRVRGGMWPERLMEAIRYWMEEAPAEPR